MADSIIDFTEKGALGGRGHSLAALRDTVRIMGRDGSHLGVGGLESLTII